MSERWRVPPAPYTEDAEVARWMQYATEALNQLPAFSIISTSDGPESNVTADSGTFAFDIGSSNTTFWAKASGDTTTGWLAVDLV